MSDCELCIWKDAIFDPQALIRFYNQQFHVSADVLANAYQAAQLMKKRSWKVKAKKRKGIRHA